MGGQKDRPQILLRIDLLHNEALDDVADLDVVEFLDLHTAFVAVCNFLDIVLKAAQGCKLALVYDDIITQNAYRAAALNLTVGDIAAGYGANLGDLIGLANLGMADDSFLEFGGKHTLHCRFDFVDAVVNGTYAYRHWNGQHYHGQRYRV